MTGASVTTEGLAIGVDIGGTKMAAVLDPGLFVVAGELSVAGDLLLRRAKRGCTDRLVAREFRLRLRSVQTGWSGTRQASSAPPTWHA